MTRPSISKDMGILVLDRTQYDDAYHLQKTLQIKRIADEIPDILIVTEHDPVVTLGSSADWDHLLRTDEDYELLGIEIFTTDRGGGVTYHGPGQIVLYPIFKLEAEERDLHLYLRKLEAIVLKLLAQYQIPATVYPGITGVFVGNRKIAQIGIRVKEWVTMHGLSFNIYPNLNHFRTIVPCGLSQYEVGSMAGELGYRPEWEKIVSQLLQSFELSFNRSPVLLDQSWLNNRCDYGEQFFRIKSPTLLPKITPSSSSLPS
ncbi:MAG: lipoyl(octanoyl) transferase LipB [Planctomycetota bacterium]